jgi:glycosyltransferase involved in cell wall biosynthesis
VKLLVVSHTAHYMRDGIVVGWGPTVREIDYLAREFEVTHIAPLHKEPAPNSALAYESQNVRMRFIEPKGGTSVSDKLSILAAYPSYAAIVYQELGKHEIIHLRCPANISLLALLVMSISPKRQKRWIKYAGSWQGSPVEPLSYRFQRWWLRQKWLHGGIVSVNGFSENQADFIHSFINPSVSDEELAEGALAAESKRLTEPIRLLFVGGVRETKGMRTVLEMMQHLLHEAALPVQLDIIGDGEERAFFEKLAIDMNLNANIVFHGAMPRDKVSGFYEKAHFIVLPSYSEGWPKVLSEAMAYGVVPLASRVGSIPFFFEQFGLPDVYEARDSQSFAEAITKYVKNPPLWESIKQKGLIAAQNFVYRRYLDDLKMALGLKNDSTG